MTHTTQQGFTLIEMITVLAIFAVLTSVVLFNYNRFTSDTILTNMAYELALSAREAQIYGVSVRQPDGSTGTADFSKSYGVFFPYVAGGTATYYLFADNNNDRVFSGTACPGSTECVTPYTLQRLTKITSLKKDCVADTNGLSVSFKRPNPEAVIDGQPTVGTAEIELTAPSGSTRYVVIRNNGQMFVTSSTICP